MEFRIWLQHIWFDHRDEVQRCGNTVNYTLSDYFNRYKWWLRREYRHQQLKEQQRLEKIRKYNDSLV